MKKSFLSNKVFRYVVIVLIFVSSEVSIYWYSARSTKQFEFTSGLSIPIHGGSYNTLTKGKNCKVFNQNKFMAMLRGGNFVLTEELLNPISLQKAASGLIITVGKGGSKGFEKMNGATIQKALDIIKTTGGRIVLKPGKYLLERTIMLEQSQNKIEIIGEPNASLVMDIMPTLILSRPCKKDDRFLVLEKVEKVAVGDRIEMQIPENTEGYSVIIESINKDTVFLKSPANFTLPIGTVINPATLPNAIKLYNHVENVSISNIEIDLQSDKQPFEPKNHSTGCGIFVESPYTYAEGPSADFCRNLTITNCHIHDCAFRGIAFYVVKDSFISNCQIENIGKRAQYSEAIDLDHYCEGIVVSNNKLKTGNVGIEFNDAANSKAIGNEIDDFDIGIRCWWWEPTKKMENMNSGNLVQKNIFKNYRNNAIWFGKNCHNNTITENTFYAVKGKSPVRVEEADNLVEKNLEIQ